MHVKVGMQILSIIVEMTEMQIKMSSISQFSKYLMKL